MYGKPLAYIAKIETIAPIEGADRIELAQVMDYSIVIKKGEYKPGDVAMYVEVDSVLPDGLEATDKAQYDEIKDSMVNLDKTSEEYLSKQAELDAISAKSKYPYFEFLRPKKFKIKSMKLGKFKVISQGILFNLKDLGVEETKVGTNLTERFNITELIQDEEEAGITSGSGKKDSWIVRKLMRFEWFRELRKKRNNYNHWLPTWPGKSDEENVQKIFSKMKAAYPDKEWVATEKLEGQNITIYSYMSRGLFRKKKDIGVCSRTRNLSPRDSAGKTFWETVKRTQLDDKIKAIDGEWFCRGEHIGPGIQGNIYKLPRTEVRFFDFYKKVDGQWKKLNFDESIAFAKEHDLQFVPVLDEHYILPDTVQEMLAQSDKKTIFGNNLEHKREGFVLRLKDDYNVSFKVKNPFYEI